MNHRRLPAVGARAISCLLLLGTWVFPTGLVSAADNGITLEQLRTERKKIAQRKRRIIFNNDGDDFSGHGGPENKRTAASAAMTVTPEGLLALRTTGLLGSQVDSIFYHSVLGMKLVYQDSAFKRIYEFPDRKPERGKIAINNCKALMANYGMDNLEVMIDCARKNGLEIFYSNRINDVHDFFFPKFLSPFKVKHPEYTLGHVEAAEERSSAETLELMRQGRKTYTGLNFQLRFIRDLTVEAMREVCRSYDIDGLELDYFRSPRLFPSASVETADGELVNLMEQLDKGLVSSSPPPADPKDVERLNDMMRKMRHMTEEEGQRRGRPILIAARGIINPEYSLGYGLDFQTWLEEDLIDIVMPIHFGIPRGKHLGSLQTFYELAHRYSVPAYPCLRFHDAYQHSWPECRGEAASRFAEGADGITTFNKFDPHHRMWHELGDPQVMRGLDQTYTCPHYLPTTVTDKGTGPLRLLVGEDVRSASPANPSRSIKLRVHVTGLTAKHDLKLEWNGKPLEPAPGSPTVGDAPGEVWLEFLPESSLFKIPENLLTARMNPAVGTVTIDDIQLDVLVSD